MQATGRRFIQYVGGVALSDIKNVKHREAVRAFGDQVEQDVRSHRYDLLKRLANYPLKDPRVKKAEIRGSEPHKSHDDPTDPQDVISVRMKDENDSRLGTAHVHEDGTSKLLTFFTVRQISFILVRSPGVGGSYAYVNNTTDIKASNIMLSIEDETILEDFEKEEQEHPKFAKDLLIDPSTRGVHNVTHNLTAVASSTSLPRAQHFLSAVNALPETAAYGSYESLLVDPNVQIVYISTPHSHHFQNARAALLAGKHVLLEKAFTVNAAQARSLIQLAREKNLFLMEAMWTRFFPLVRYVRQLIKDGAIGAVQRVVADRNLGRNVEKLYGTEHRLVNPALAGGALLDLAIYPLTWIFQILYHDDPLASGTVRSPPHISSSVIKYTPTGVDETTTVVVTFPESQTQGVATASLRLTSDPTDPGVRILGDRGQIQVFGPAARPLSIVRIAYGEEGPEVVERKDFEIPVGHGLFWEADACAQYLAEGKTESDLMPLEETLLIMEVMDRVREQDGIKYPVEVEAH
ncbi:hypothetical protein APSETT444_005185 [Aspergillus pseudonomiae]